jgi:hypothetical protein
MHTGQGRHQPCQRDPIPLHIHPTCPLVPFHMKAMADVPRTEVFPTGSQKTGLRSSLQWRCESNIRKLGAVGAEGLQRGQEVGSWWRPRPWNKGTRGLCSALTGLRLAALLLHSCLQPLSTALPAPAHKSTFNAHHSWLPGCPAVPHLLLAECEPLNISQLSG